MATPGYPKQEQHDGGQKDTETEPVDAPEGLPLCLVLVEKSKSRGMVAEEKEKEGDSRHDGWQVIIPSPSFVDVCAQRDSFLAPWSQPGSKFHPRKLTNDRIEKAHWEKASPDESNRQEAMLLRHQFGKGTATALDERGRDAN